MDIIHIKAQGSVSEPVRRYHLDIPFPNEHLNFPVDESRAAWQSKIRYMNHNDQLVRLGIILFVVMMRREVTQMSVRTHNFAVSITPGSPANNAKRWAKIDQLVATIAGQSGHTIGSHPWGWNRHSFPALPVEFETFETETAVGPAPAHCLQIELPAGFNSVLLLIRRGIDSWGMVKLTDADKLRPEVAQLLTELSRMPELSKIRLTSRLIECSYGLAYRKIAVEPYIREIVARHVERALQSTG